MASDFAQQNEAAIQQDFAKMNWTQSQQSFRAKNQRLLQDGRIKAPAATAAPREMIIFQTEDENIPRAQLRLDIRQHELSAETGRHSHVDHRTAEFLLHNIRFEAKGDIRSSQKNDPWRRGRFEPSMLVHDTGEIIRLARDKLFHKRA